MATKREPYRETRWLVQLLEEDRWVTWHESTTKYRAQEILREKRGPKRGTYRHGWTWRIIKCELREVAG